MAKKIEKKTGFARTQQGNFTKFYTIAPTSTVEWDQLAWSYLETRAEAALGYQPGYVEMDGKVIIGFKNPQDVFVS